MNGQRPTNNDYLLRSFNDFDQPPTLHFAERAGFHDTHRVAYVASVLLIVCEEFLGTFHELAVQRVHKAALYLYSDGFIHFVGDDHAGLLLAKISYYCFHL